MQGAPTPLLKLWKEAGAVDVHGCREFSMFLFSVSEDAPIFGVFNEYHLNMQALCKLKNKAIF